MNDRSSETATMFVVIEIPYDTFRIRAACSTREEAEALVGEHENATEFSLDIFEITAGCAWKGIGYDDGWESEAS